MRIKTLYFRTLFFVFLVSTMQVSTQTATPSAASPPEFVKRGQQLLREGKVEEAVQLYQQTLQASPDSVAANNAMGVVLDLMGQGSEARKYFAKAIELAATGQAKAAVQRAMAMSYAFEGNCKRTIENEQKVLDYYIAVGDFYQQGEIADEAARVCIDSGDLDAASKWYQMGHDLGLREPEIKPDRRDLWEFRLQHALARIAVRHGNKDEAEKHVSAARAILDKGTNPAQAPFFPYLTGYVAFYNRDYKTALEELQKANQNDPFIECLIGQTYDKLGDQEKAKDFYHKAAMTSAHNPPAAYAKRFIRKQ